MTATKTVAVDPVIEPLAVALAEAEVAAEKAATSRREAEAARAAVLERVWDKDAARAAIVARRAAGVERPEDGADLALIAADKEVLDGLLAQRDAVVAETKAAAERAVCDLTQARANLGRAELERFAAALPPRLEELAGLLLQGIQQANAAEERLGRGRTSWMPSVALESALTPFFATRPR